MSGTNRLSDFLGKEFKSLLLSFDQQLNLYSHEGNIETYGLEEEGIQGKSIFEILPFLYGMALDKDYQLPYIHFFPGIVTDVYVYPGNGGVDIVVLESSDKHDMHQEVQQLANERSILNYRLKQLSERLAKSNLLLEKANRAKSDFIAGVSHELKTPLSSILGYAEYLSRNVSPLNTESSASIQVIKRNGNYLLSLIDNLLEHGRVESGQVAITQRPTDVAALFRDLYELIYPLAAKKGLDFVLKAQNSGLWLLFDEQHLKQILINILTNAVKYTHSGSVVFEAEYQDGHLISRIHDTGIGIPEDAIENILLPFHQHKHSSSADGVGLGLSVSSRLVEMMKGQLDIKSRPGKGTVVSVTIPAPLLDQTSESARHLNKPSVQPRILLVEDDPDLSHLFSFLLTDQGMLVESVTDPAGVNDQLRRQTPELILMDQDINGSSGISLIEQIKQDGYPGKIIMMTASNDRSLMEKAYSLGCRDFLLKPIS
jgi:signal transduction histidine kinase